MNSTGHYSIYLIHFCFFLLFPLISIGQNTNSWELVKDKYGIQVYNKKTEGTKLKDSKAVMIVKSSVDAVKKELTDIPNQKNWMDRIVKSEMLKKNSNTDFIAYYEAGAPWPVSNRDVVSHYKITEINGTIKIDVLAKPDFIPENKSIVRIKEAVSSWTITPKGDGNVEVVYINHANPGGSIPDWLANSSSTSSPFNTMKGLKERLGGN